MEPQNSSLAKALKYRHRLKAIFFGLWVITSLVGVGFTIFFLKDHSLSETIDLVVSFVGENTNTILLALLGLYLLRTIIFVPVSLLHAAVGIMLPHSPVMAIAVGSVGAMLSAFLSFWIARGLGREWVADHESDRLRHFDEKVSERGFFTIFILRILVFVPFDLINLASGFSSMRFRDYALGTVVGVVPEVATYTLIGSSLFNRKGLVVLAVMVCIVGWVTYYAKTHPHFRELINPVKQYQKFRAKRKKKKKRGKRKKRF